MQLDRHPHARAVLGGALPPGGSPSHAYMFHGPAGSGKRAAALEFAAALLCDGAADPEGARARVQHGVHPDLTVVTPSGAAEMLVGDVDEAVVAAASRTPFESTRRVFIIEQAETMNDQAANRMLKTLEEPPPFAHLILLTDRLANVMETIASRCQPVRFEAPTAAELAERLRSRVAEDVAVASARLARGDGDRAVALAVGEGPALRAAAEGFARSALHGRLETQPWAPLLERARARGELAGDDVRAKIAGEAEYLPDKDARRAKKDGEIVARRAARRAQADTIDQALELAALWFRDVACIATSPELVLNADRLEELRADSEVLTGQPARLHEAMEICDAARTVLVRNPGEELLLETLASRLERLLRS